MLTPFVNVTREFSFIGENRTIFVASGILTYYAAELSKTYQSLHVLELVYCWSYQDFSVMRLMLGRRGEKNGNTS